MINTITKSGGELVPFDPDKLNRWAAWADRSGADWSTISLDAVSKLQDGCSSQDVNKAIISACMDQFDEASFKLAGRIMAGMIYKEAYGSFKNIPTLSEHMGNMVELGYWEKMDYSEEDIEHLNSLIDHSKDLELNYSEIKQLNDKYLIRDRVKRVTKESPQMMYMGMAMANMSNQPKNRRLKDVEKLYHYLSVKAINAPTPFMSYLRTPHRNYASCCVATCNDTIPSLSAADHIYYMMTANSAGIGSHLKTRSSGDPIRGGTVEHQGKFGYINAISAMVKANLQGGRGGAATVHLCALDPEIFMMLKLRNVKTPSERRISGVQYSFGYNKLFAKKVKDDKEWLLISYLHAPDLWEAMYSDNEELFENLYNKYLEKDVPKKIVSAKELAVLSLIQGVETGGVYQENSTEMNKHTPFKNPIYSSNLCKEIALPTKGYDCVTDLYKEEETSGEIGLCNLAAIVAGRVPEESLTELYYYTLLMVDNVISLMEYPFPNLSFTAQARRSVAIGLTNLANFMAKNDKKYSTGDGKEFIHRVAEKHSYLLHKASLTLAKEKGVCDWIGKTKYPEGWLPIDSYNKNVDKVVKQDLLCDWEFLRAEIKEVGGIRNSVLEGMMPNESSSIATNGTNSILPVRSLKVVKTNAGNTTKFIAPDYEEFSSNYEIAWEIPSKDLIDVYSIFQKFCGQAISADLYIDQSKGGKVSESKLLSDWLRMTMLGVKTRYYINTKTASGDKEDKAPEVEEFEGEDKGCSSGACTI